MTRAATWAALAVALAAPDGPARAEDRKKGDKAIPVVYDGHLLVVATADGVAAFAFAERVDKGTTYRFRFRPADGGKEQTGEGKVFERYKAVQGAGGPNDVSYFYDGGELWLTAGPVKILWSRGDEKSGWLYFHPDKVRVQAVEGTDLGALDLKRFAK
jgi:hypothetical protein